MAEQGDLLAMLAPQIPMPTPTYHQETYPRLNPSKTTFSGAGKTVLITAGATGIGFEISKSFAQAGVKRIIVVSRRAEPQAKAKAAIEGDYPGTTVECHQISATDRDAMTKLLQTVGDIDVLVLSHAVGNSTNVTSLDLPLAEFQDNFETNVIGPVHILQTYLKLPKPTAGSKTVIHVSTASAHLQAPRQAAYGPSKGAFSRILGYFAEEQGVANGVRIFSYHPGAFYTEAAAKLVDKNAMTWEDITLPGHFAVWLASPEADFLHGRFLWAHWDVDEMIEKFPALLEEKPWRFRLGLTV